MPNIQVKEFYLYMYMKPISCAERWIFISQWSKFHFQIFLDTGFGEKKIWIIWTRVDLFCFSIPILYLCAKFVIWSQRSTKSDVLKFGPVSEQGTETIFYKETAIFFLSTKCFINVDRSSLWLCQQIVQWKTRKLELRCGTNIGTHQAKIEKISISRAILLGFLRSPVSVMQCEANKSNRQHE